MRCKHGRTATTLVSIGLLAVLSLPSFVYGQADPTARPTIGEAEINANDVYVRSGDSLNHYTIIKLKAGDKVSVVAERGEWYEILPPEGAFSLVSADFVDTADNQKGVVNGSNVRVRAGSALNENKYTVQTLLNKGAEVTILGKNPDGFLRIKPPTGATLWINKSFANLNGQPAVPTSGKITEASPRSDVTAETTTVPPTETASASVAEQPKVITPRPAVSGAASEAQQRKLTELDSALTKEYAKPAGERNLDSFLSQYRTILADAKEEFIQQYAQRRIEEVQTAIEATGSIGHWKKIEEIAEAKRREYRTARAAIPEAAPAAPSIEAKGELRVSALFPPGATPERYRLIDPIAGERTIAYVEIPTGSAIRINEYLNKYVGVRALERRVQTGGVNPIPIYIADDLVLLEPPDAQSSALPSP